MDQSLRFALNAFGHFIQDIGRLVNPATLLGDWAVFFLEGIQKPSDPSPMASLGAADRPSRLSCPSSSRQDWVLSR